MKKLIGNLLIVSIVSLLMLIIGEFVSRQIMLISPGPRIVDMQGNALNISYIEPGQTFRIVTPDFDAKTSITPDGYRAPAVQGNPDIIFVGDSFTYAQGVRDDEAFPYLFCKDKQIQCVNLAVPGASTQYELARLEQYLKQKQWRPKQVKLFFFTGNDFEDNLVADKRQRNGKNIEPEEIRPVEAEAKKGLRQRLMERGFKVSNLLRIAYFKVLPIIRENPEGKHKQLQQALQITQQAFQYLHRLSQQYGFEYQIYSLHTQIQLERGLHIELDQKLQSISVKPLISLGKALSGDPAKYFFPSDGHYSVAGNLKVAEFLGALYGGRSARLQ